MLSSRLDAQTERDLALLMDANADPQFLLGFFRTLGLFKPRDPKSKYNPRKKGRTKLYWNKCLERAFRRSDRIKSRRRLENVRKACDELWILLASWHPGEIKTQ